MNKNNIKKYFVILDIDPDASEEEIKKAYKDMIQIWHPDRFSHNARLHTKAELKTKEINEAYEKIKKYLYYDPKMSDMENSNFSFENETRKYNNETKESKFEIGPLGYVLLGMTIGGGIIISLFDLPPTPSGFLGALVGLLIWSLIKNKSN